MSTLDSSVIKARNKLLILFVVLTILDIVLVAVSRDMWAIGRIAFTVAVMYFVMQGYKWAKWLLVGILSLVVVSLIALLVALHFKLSTFLIVGSLIMIVLSILTEVILICDRDLKHYFAFKRRSAVR